MSPDGASAFRGVTIYPGIRHMYRSVHLAIATVRWWFGATYAITGTGCLVAAPIMISRADFGGVYMLVGGVLLTALGWVIHPWGLERQRRSSARALRA